MEDLNDLEKFEDCLVIHKLEGSWVAGIGEKWNTFGDGTYHGVDSRLKPYAIGATAKEAVNKLWEIVKTQP